MEGPSHKIAFITGTSGAGGAERVMATLANAYADRGWKVSILTFEKPGVIPFYSFHPEISFTPLGETHPTISRILPIRLLFLLKSLRRTIEEIKPDIILSFIDRANILTLAATSGLPYPVIVSEHTDPDRNLKSETGNWRLWNILRRWTYPRASSVVVLSQEARLALPVLIQSNCVIIPNPVQTSSFIQPLPDKDRLAQVISAGRLVESKQFDLLIQVFAKIQPHHPGWKLVIYGEGPERNHLEELIRKLGVEQIVALPGQTDKIFKAFSNSRLFALTSRYETFGMALAEAMACGLPAISFDLPGGPRQIVRHEVDGLLVPAGDVHLFAEALDRLMGDQDLRQKFATHAIEVSVRFSIQNILKMWDHLFAHVAPDIFRAEEQT